MESKWNSSFVNNLLRFYSCYNIIIIRNSYSLQLCPFFFFFLLKFVKKLFGISSNRFTIQTKSCISRELDFNKRIILLVQNSFHDQPLSTSIVLFEHLILQIKHRWPRESVCTIDSNISRNDSNIFSRLEAIFKILLKAKTLD